MLAPYKGRTGLRYLEIGLGEGETTVWMLENILTHPSARMTGIDIFPGDLKERFVSNLRISGYAHKVKIMTGESQAVLKRLPAEYFDIIYIDVSHSAADVLADAVLSWPLLKKGGLLIFDDYLMSVIKPGPERFPDSLPKDIDRLAPFLPAEASPKIAVDAFITAHRNNLDVVYRGYQVILKKRRSGNFLHIGDYRYRWSRKKLYSVETGEEVPLSRDEQEIVERLFISRAFGETVFHLDAELMDDRTASELKKRLNLSF